MNARILVEVAGDRLLGRRVLTEAIGFYPCGAAVVVEMAPDPYVPEILFEVEHPARGQATFNDSEVWEAAGVALGVDWFIPKDCLRDELPGAIDQLFSGRAGNAEGQRT